MWTTQHLLKAGARAQLELAEGQAGKN